jgi:nucleoside phosphorylase
VGGACVLLLKSGVHLAYDGPATSMRRLVVEIAQAVRPKVMITTGTAGAIGADVLLGDVVIAALTRFDCTKQFKKSLGPRPRTRPPHCPPARSPRSPPI